MHPYLLGLKRTAKLNKDLLTLFQKIKIEASIHSLTAVLIPIRRDMWGRWFGVKIQETYQIQRSLIPKNGQRRILPTS